MPIQKKRDEIMSAFENIFSLSGIHPELKDELKIVLQTSLNEITEAAYREGRDSVLKEIQHDQEKFLDGFAHPKGCGECEKS